MQLLARHYATGEPIAITCANRVIHSIAPVSNIPAEQGLPWVAPALFDLQINGCDGHSFNSERLTPQTVRHVVTVCHRHGIGALCPTLVTNGFEALAHGMATIRQAREGDAQIAAAIPAIHLEGPYICPEDGPRGAHPKQHVRPADWNEFCRLQDAAGGLIRLVTLAPEVPGALPLIERLVAAGVVVALGHTAADRECIQSAAAAGARLSTHLGNGSHAVLPRHDNYLWEQLGNDALWASLICDGHHLPPMVVRCMVRAKTPERTILTCDASSLAGLPPGRYGEWGQEFEVRPEGKIVVPGTTYLAGSWAFTDLCVGNVIRYAGVSLRDAVDMASARPRALLGLEPRRLEPGQPADLVLFEWEPGSDFRVRNLLQQGSWQLVS